MIKRTVFADPLGSFEKCSGNKDTGRQAVLTLRCRFLFLFLFVVESIAWLLVFLIGRNRASSTATAACWTSVTDQST